jgi:hypothetical protein
METNTYGNKEIETETPLRRVISECDDCDMDNVVADVRMDESQNNGGEWLCGFVERNISSTSNFGYRGYPLVPGAYENEGVGFGNPGSGISDITLSTRLDPSDAGAPLTIIEGYVRRSAERGDDVNHCDLDDDNSKYEDNSSLSCDDGSEETAVDINNMILLHELHGTTSNDYSNINNNRLAVDPRVFPIPPVILKKQPQQKQQEQSHSSSVNGDYSNIDNTMARIDEGLTSNDSYESGSHASSSQRAPSSQTSDWGYFEDVHQSNDGHTANSSNNVNKTNSSNKKSRKLNTMMMITGKNTMSTTNGINRGNIVAIAAAHRHHHPNTISNDSVLATQDAEGSGKNK